MRVIPISADASVTLVDESSACDTDHGQVPRLDLPLTRRSLLRGTGVLVGTIAAGSPLALLAPSPVWAVELKSLSQAEGEALMAMGRTLYPHEKLPDAVYALLAKDLDGQAAGDAAKAKLLKAGVAALDKAAGGSFAKATPAKRLAVVKGLARTPFFGAVRGQCITSLYDNDMAFQVFGYPGSAWERGGYITRGFQDLQWLPAPPADASPAPWMG